MAFIQLSDVHLSFPSSYNKEFRIIDFFQDRFRKKVGRDEFSSHSSVLEGISFEISAGETVGVLGRNGAGKTTLLKLISGIYAPDKGIVNVKGKAQSFLSLGTGFDNRLSGRENIFLNGLILGLHKEEIIKKIDDIAEFSEIGPHLHKPMKYYSSGMISRLSFAISMMLKSDILLIDEIFSVGDIAFQEKSSQAMQESLAKTAIKIIVTHSLDLILKVCNRCIVLENKKIAFDGQPQQAVDFFKNTMKREDK